MYFTAFVLNDLWQEGQRNLYIYEMTKSSKVLRHKIRDIGVFDECILIAVGDDKTSPKHRILFTGTNPAKRSLSDSMFYTDFTSVKSNFSDKKEIKALEDEIAKLELDFKHVSDMLIGRKKRHERLSKGLASEEIVKYEALDKAERDAINEALQKKYYRPSARYGTDPLFTFFIDRILAHAKDGKTKDELIQELNKKTNEELDTILKQTIKA